MNTYPPLFCILLLLCLLPANGAAVPSGQIITWEGGGQGTVKFEGEEHAEHGYACDACHPRLFAEKKGSAKMTMADMNQGRYCGACHNGKTTFGTNDPRKCHECHRTGKGRDHHSERDH
jgi:c(7)-type cytochrome triheme protein